MGLRRSEATSRILWSPMITRRAFISSISKRKKVVSSVDALQQADYYTDNVFFLPSPEKSCDLESVAAAWEATKAVKLEKCEGKGKSGEVV